MKKSVILCLFVALCLAAVTGTVAYFTDSIAVQNEVKSGNLDIEQVEYERATDADGTYLKGYTQKQAIYPCMNQVETEERPDVTVATKDGDVSITAKLNQTIQGYVDKIVVSTNHGSLNAYIRTLVAVPTAFAEAVHLDWNLDKAEEPTGWVRGETFTADIHGVNHTIQYATYYTAIGPNESAAPSLLGFYLDSAVGHDGEQYTLGTTKLGSGSELKILVATQAAQAIPTGIGERTTRARAVESLRETYDKNEDGTYTIHHPWMPAKTNSPTETNP